MRLETSNVHRGDLQRVAVRSHPGAQVVIPGLILQSLGLRLCLLNISDVSSGKTPVNEELTEVLHSTTTNIGQRATSREVGLQLNSHSLRWSYALPLDLVTGDGVGQPDWELYNSRSGTSSTGERVLALVSLYEAAARMFGRKLRVLSPVFLSNSPLIEPDYQHVWGSLLSPDDVLQFAQLTVCKGVARINVVDQDDFGSLLHLNLVFEACASNGPVFVVNPRLQSLLVGSKVNGLQCDHVSWQTLDVLAVAFGDIIPGAANEEIDFLKVLVAVLPNSGLQQVQIFISLFPNSHPVQAVGEVLVLSLAMVLLQHNGLEHWPPGICCVHRSELLTVGLVKDPVPLDWLQLHQISKEHHCHTSEWFPVLLFDLLQSGVQSVEKLTFHHGNLINDDERQVFELGSLHVQLSAVYPCVAGILSAKGKVEGCVQGVAPDLTGSSPCERQLQNMWTVKVVSILFQDLLGDVGTNIDHCRLATSSPSSNYEEWSHRWGIADFSRLHQIPAVFNNNVEDLCLEFVQAHDSFPELIIRWKLNPFEGSRLFVVVCLCVDVLQLGGVEVDKVRVVALSHLGTLFIVLRCLRIQIDSRLSEVQLFLKLLNHIPGFLHTLQMGHHLPLDNGNFSLSLVFLIVQLHNVLLVGGDLLSPRSVEHQLAIHEPFGFLVPSSLVLSQSCSLFSPPHLSGLSRDRV